MVFFCTCATFTVLENMPHGAHSGPSGVRLAAGVPAPGGAHLQLLPAGEPAGGRVVRALRGAAADEPRGRAQVLPARARAHGVHQHRYARPWARPALRPGATRSDRGLAVAPSLPWRPASGRGACWLRRPSCGRPCGFGEAAGSRMWGDWGAM